MIEALSSERLPQPRFRYSQLIKAGPYLQSAGMIALDRSSGALAAGGVYHETRKILENLIEALPDFGLSLAHMVSARLFTTQFSQFAEINRAWEETFSEDLRPPARTAVGVSALPLGASVEIEFSFYKAESEEINGSQCESS